jgi:hypothetical protein
MYEPLLGEEIGAGIAGSLLGGRKSGIQKDAERAGKTLIPQLTAGAENYGQSSKEFGQIALPAVGKAAGFYGSLIGDNSTESLNAQLGPERENLTEGAHRGLITQLNEFSGRGGGRVAMQGQALQNLNRQLMGMVATGRQNAAQGLLSSGQIAGNLSAQFASLSSQQQQALAAFISDLMNGGNRQRAQSGAFYGGLAGTLGGILADILNGTGGAAVGGGGGGGSYDSGD